MKLNIEELARKSGIDCDSLPAVSRGPVYVATPEELEAFARLIVEQCACVCDSKYQIRSDVGFPREASTARALRDAIRKLLED